MEHQKANRQRSGRLSDMRSIYAIRMDRVKAAKTWLAASGIGLSSKYRSLPAHRRSEGRTSEGL